MKNIMMFLIILLMFLPVVYNLCMMCLNFIYYQTVIFSLQIKSYEKTECHDERRKLAREIYDNFIMKEMLSHTHVSGFLIKFFICKFQFFFDIMILEGISSTIVWTCWWYILSGTIHFLGYCYVWFVCC